MCLFIMLSLVSIVGLFDDRSKSFLQQMVPFDVLIILLIDVSKAQQCGEDKQ